MVASGVLCVVPCGKAAKKFAHECAVPWSVKVYPGADHFAFVSNPWAEDLAGDVRDFIRRNMGYVEVSHRSLRLKAGKNEMASESPIA